MKIDSAASAFSSGNHVRDVALLIMKMSEAIHSALRRLAPGVAGTQSSSLYALLTEEYALRARANILLIEAERFARPNFPTIQQDVLGVLYQVEEELKGALSAERLAELIVGLMLFANSLVSKKNKTIFLLLQELKETLCLSHPAQDR